MKLSDISEIYQLLCEGTENLSSRQSSFALRKEAFSQNVPMVKNAFDTRRINQETDYIPRRGLQNYHRSEKFVSEAISKKIEGFTRLKITLDKLKLQYGKSSEWQDSYTRVLASAIDKGLRTDQSDGDFSDAQPSMGSLDYLEELMYVRYRLSADNLLTMSDDELCQHILSKDEVLVRQGGNNFTNFQVVPSDVSKFSYDGMVDRMLATMAQVMTSYKPPQQDDNLTNKLFGSLDNLKGERTVTITIKNSKKTELEKVAIENDIIEDME